MKDIKLYRGDNLQRLFNRNNYWYEGLLINGAHGGNPYTITDQEITELITKHVYPENNDFKYHKVSDFMSFSKDKKVALGYIENQVKSSFNLDYKSFIITWSLNNLIQIREGIYSANYTINYTNSTKILNSIIDNITGRGYCHIIPLDSLKSQFEGLISSVTIFDLEQIIQDVKIFDTTTQNRIKKDKEVLVLPSDINKYDPSLNLETIIRPNKEFSFDFFQ